RLRVRAGPDRADRRGAGAGPRPGRVLSWAPRAAPVRPVPPTRGPAVGRSAERRLDDGRTGRVNGGRRCLRAAQSTLAGRPPGPAARPRCRPRIPRLRVAGDRRRPGGGGQTRAADRRGPDGQRADPRPPAPRRGPARRLLVASVRAGRVGERPQPFVEPSVSPRTNCFESTRYSTTVGMATMNAAAA